MKKHNRYAVLGFNALRRVAIKIAENANKNNYKIPVWKGGHIVYEIPKINTKQNTPVDAK